ncbi:ABC transporter permease [Cryptosporangium aurantiacum]|uniref:Osmoprotectant transport system permease protein n=1 Tax=Cryptosporangium aurantiacum TaxID=134849 RepID=A0A1M7PTF2_9ACTN|nr:ABC transporter permease [Cryptosporangium aurantiacum]SHN20748.1 osmoprotectant transport system permease protein [Cryptosporangium aurantiacum]
MTWDWRWSWIPDHYDLLGELLAQHLYLSVVPVILGLLIALPLGIVCVRLRRLYAPVLALTSIFYALPSLALFVVLIDYTGFTGWTVIIPLTIYTLSVLVRNVVDGLRSVPEHVSQAATAMGFGGVRRLIQVDLPIAVPVVIAGLRVATVSNVSLVSVGSLIGISGLGQLFVDGIQRSFITPIIVGIVLTVALAVILDAVLVGVQWLLTPWTRGGGSVLTVEEPVADPATTGVAA